MMRSWLDCKPSPLWQSFSAKAYRSVHLSTLRPADPSSSPLPPARWKIFWRRIMHVENRTLWYRLLHRKLYCQMSLRTIRQLPSSQCLHCHLQEESLEHLFVLCPAKLPIWFSIFAHFLPGFRVSSSQILQFLFALSIPSLPSISSTIWILCSCTIQAIWRHHWAFVNQQIPFHSATIISDIKLFFDQLRPPPYLRLVPFPTSPLS